MIELELSEDEVILVRACLRFRALDLTSERKTVYVKLAETMNCVGFYRFDSFEAACIYLGLVEFARHNELLNGESSLSRQTRGLADLFFILMFHRKLDDHVRNVVDRTFERMEERTVIAIA